MKTNKKKQPFKNNEIFGAEIDAKDHNLNGIVERNKESSLSNEFCDWLEGDFSL